MSLPTSLSRFTAYYRRHGMRATVGRLGLAVKRTAFSSRMVIFYCDLREQDLPKTELPPSLRIERHRSQTDLRSEDLELIISLWNPRLAQRNMKERFTLGASLWLIRFKDQLAGYGWTLKGHTVEPHYFPMAEHDVQFFDFHVFPKYRGRGMDWCLMTCILERLASEGGARAYGEAAEWNKPSLSSFAMTPFRRLGSGRKLTIFGYTITCWTKERAARPAKAKSSSGAPRRTKVSDLPGFQK